MNNIEIGPIRPPSESDSLLIRVTRGCHWNKCYFCGLYKNMSFSMRPIDEVIADIQGQSERYRDRNYTSCFLQDGDALVLKTEYLLQILEAIKKYFPFLKHVTTYARADSITRKSSDELNELRQAGLDHLYCGMETGSDAVLKLINKGFNADTVIKSGCMTKEAGMILSEFTLLGIGGKELSNENAIKTAEVLNIIKPDFIRVHATGFKPELKMGQLIREGSVTLQSEEEIVMEQRLFLQKLDKAFRGLRQRMGLLADPADGDGIVKALDGTLDHPLRPVAFGDEAGTQIIALTLLHDHQALIESVDNGDLLGIKVRHQHLLLQNGGCVGVQLVHDAGIRV